MTAPTGASALKALAGCTCHLAADDAECPCRVCPELARQAAGCPCRLEQFADSRARSDRPYDGLCDGCFTLARDVRDCGLRVAEHVPVLPGAPFNPPPPAGAPGVVWQRCGHIGISAWPYAGQYTDTPEVEVCNAWHAWSTDGPQPWSRQPAGSGAPWAACFRGPKRSVPRHPSRRWRHRLRPDLDHHLDQEELTMRQRRIPEFDNRDVTALELALTGKGAPGRTLELGETYYAVAEITVVDVGHKIDEDTEEVTRVHRGKVKGLALVDEGVWIAVQVRARRAADQARGQGTIDLPGLDRHDAAGAGAELDAMAHADLDRAPAASQPAPHLTDGDGLDLPAVHDPTAGREHGDPDPDIEPAGATTAAPMAGMTAGGEG